MTDGSVLEARIEMQGLSERIERLLEAYLRTCVAEAEAAGAGGGALTREIARVIAAGGKRLRPAFCYWGYRAAGGEDGEPILRASAAMELLHTMALVHDDLLDGAPERRGAPTTRPWMAARAAAVAPSAEPETFGMAVAVLTGDLAAVLADRLLLESGFAPDALARALSIYHDMRIDTAVGQYLDLAGRSDEPDQALQVARLKGGAYTVEGPLLVGAAFADAGPHVRAVLARYGRDLGEAFQLRDDLRDGDAAEPVSAETVDALVDRASTVLVDAPIDAEARQVLEAMARSVGMP